MTRKTTLSLIRRYYDAFNAGDPQGMLACLTDDIEHRVNEGGHRIGKAKFAEFFGHMGVSYREDQTSLAAGPPVSLPRAAIAEPLGKRPFRCSGRSCFDKCARRSLTETL